MQDEWEERLVLNFCLKSSENIVNFKTCDDIVLVFTEKK